MVDLLKPVTFTARPSVSTCARCLGVLNDAGDGAPQSLPERIRPSFRCFAARSESCEYVNAHLGPIHSQNCWPGCRSPKYVSIVRNNADRGLTRQPDLLIGHLQPRGTELIIAGPAVLAE